MCIENEVIKILHAFHNILISLVCRLNMEIKGNVKMKKRLKGKFVILMRRKFNFKLMIENIFKCNFRGSERSNNLKNS